MYPESNLYLKCLNAGKGVRRCGDAGVQERGFPYKKVGDVRSLTLISVFRVNFHQSLKSGLLAPGIRLTF